MVFDLTVYFKGNPTPIMNKVRLSCQDTMDAVSASGALIRDWFNDNANKIGSEPGRVNVISDVEFHIGTVHHNNEYFDITCLLSIKSITPDSMFDDHELRPKLRRLVRGEAVSIGDYFGLEAHKATLIEDRDGTVVDRVIGEGGKDDIGSLLWRAVWRVDASSDIGSGSSELKAKQKGNLCIVGLTTMNGVTGA